MAIIKWHSLSADEVLSKVKGSTQGLTEGEAAKRFASLGANELPRQKPYSKLRLFFNQFNNPLMFILFGTIAVSLYLRHFSDTIMIVVVMLANTMVGYYQENKANNSIAKLQKLVKIQARVIRNGQEKEIDSRELVAGDLIILHAGAKIPADSRIIECRTFKTNEASLTGESVPSDKQTKELKPETELADRTNMVFMGTLVEEGFARAVVVATGMGTQMGEIVSLLSQTDEPQTPLQRQMLALAKWAAFLVISIILLILIIGFVRYENTSEILLASLSLAVSAVPSGLLPAITLILVLGMHRILKQNGLVRKLVANETLGSVTVICTDKTGTLTEGQMAVTHLITATKELGREKLTKFSVSDPAAASEPIKELARIAMLNNDAYLENPEAAPKNWVLRGKTTEQALLRASALMGFNQKFLNQEYLLLDKIYFSSEFKYSASLRAMDGNGAGLFAIGAPEIILKMVSGAANPKGPQFSRESEEFKKLTQRIDILAKQGLRVIAAASRTWSEKPKYKKLHELSQNLVLSGLIALEDPIRSEVVESISVASRAGIRTVIVTGDHRLTAMAVAEQIGLKASGKEILDGQDLEAMDDPALELLAPGIKIYSRVTPKHKLRIVAALKSRGEIVAMVGDGVNDAPALKASDIGVVVNSGTDVAKEVADLILLDNGFHSIVKAIEQGRIIFANIRKVFIYLVADDFSELFIFIAALLMGLPLPLLPAQILWINIVEDGLPDLALSTEQETDHIMNQPPTKHGEMVLNQPLKRWLGAIFVISGLAAFLLFWGVYQTGADLGKVRTMVFALMGLDSLIFAFCVRSFHKSIFRRDIFSNRWLVAAALMSLSLLLLAIYAPFMHSFLNTQNLSFNNWLIILLVAGVEIVLLETTKKIFVSAKI
ncbi:MAG: hypothetical protein A3J07_03145 [Candidatus Doudnabacteria bacterium RIFCSPLOWO2_02_FULL_49_13]|uniref:Cation-transporting P-type ATPase N-terminal domain-containing protein n=1 Tax=Candidatus Doudnabacteria bacterium RIFCSPHIGHO2_12_FULL_48_16 TaxID=1817838 RepID=A0A1F5PJ55_9BACT|nr:MAG: hypothetical protein A3B77_01950 [Candidatus Doudnabacteria bacterium RIFCSPHIGHO2_02_FULL_49_24]OGE89007.1 MAG: hypothetical protein A2760_00070 [Candidatus Doudnabacteria bacterium RIFCSPHIGHO2_01_FULL_50_67]OGE89702.1 MAG: hypothetical protein A3E29_00605 [Candidatus Doudnabacteria bacterium RIFCSPHIGHO2_12_FULL_48_16]OGE97536.1 MAG: hypothetical protein A2990_02345 [Candidatus Doudnabacteria bacterium RIFCSPLOWO2_01_FULL_49_40]OGF03060.1 MAG: hypothetical protein A3J07_03145 [Candid